MAIPHAFVTTRIDTHRWPESIPGGGKLVEGHDRLRAGRSPVQPAAAWVLAGPRRAHHPDPQHKVRDDGLVRVLVPLPDRDFDVTEVAVPWRVLCDAGHQVVFATERAGTVPAADPRLLTGVIFGQLGAAPEAKRYYSELAQAAEFNGTQAWELLDVAAFDGLLLPGGHAPGMRQYLDSAVLRDQVARFWALGRPVGAICHGVLVLARARDPATGRSVLADRRTTCLPKYMERLAYWSTGWRLGRYYRTYPAYVEDEVQAALNDPGSQFRRGPLVLTARGTATDDAPAFTVTDRNYLSARWPGDAYLFGRRFAALLHATAQPGH
jgi:putative intracellular protease/amidase